MKTFFTLAAVACATLAVASGEEMSSVHLRVHTLEKGGECTIWSYSQCDGQNWTGSTCCRDPNDECRWNDNGSVKLCLKKKGYHHHHKSHHHEEKGVATWGSCTNGESCSGSDTCVRHSAYYAQCKPKTLGQSELCGQNDGTNVWKYDRCPSGQKCLPMGTDFRCQSKKHHHHHKSHHHEEKGVATWGSCTNGESCSGSDTCVRHSAYYAQCKPKTLGQSELCGQNDGTNVWKYDRCPSGQKCLPMGSDFRCQ